VQPISLANEAVVSHAHPSPSAARYDCLPWLSEVLVHAIVSDGLQCSHVLDSGASISERAVRAELTRSLHVVLPRPGFPPSLPLSHFHVAYEHP